MSAPTTSPETQFAPDLLQSFITPEFRVEGPQKVTGGASYTADLRLPGMLWAKFLRSPVPHARIVSIDATAARTVSGVHAVLTGADIGLRLFGRFLYDWPVLAVDRVLFVGERVAAVAAETREAADEALRLIQIEYDELPAIFDPEAALADGAPLLHPDPSGYHYIAGQRPPLPHLNLQGHRFVQKGEKDIEAVFAQAYRVYEDVYDAPRQHQGYIEPHACVVWIDEQGTVRVRTTNKSPFGLRYQISHVTGVPQSQIVVDSQYIGGDFGGKGLSIDEYACYYLARATGRPIRAIMTYAEELQSTNPRHAARFYLRTGVTREGKVIAHQSRAYFNGGAYGGAKPMPGLIVPAGWGALEVYQVPNTHLETFVTYANVVPSGHVRAPGALQMGLAGEGHVDHMARDLGIDPFAFRYLNALRPGNRGPANEGIRNPRGVEVLDAIKRESQWGEKPLPPNHGRGIAFRHRHIGQGKTEIVLRMLPNGQIEALYGTPDQGSGSHTVVRRIAAAVIGVAPERIAVRYGTTAEAPMDPGSGASRVTHIVGQATIRGATTLKESLQDLAAEVMGWPAGSVRIENDRFVAGDSTESAPFAEVAERILRGGTVEAHGQFDSGYQGDQHDNDYSFYAFMIEVAVDPETGHVRVVDAVMAVDIGIVINPIAHQGQIDGSFVFGLGNALMEELSEEDGRITTASLADYKLPTQMDIPPLKTVLVHTDVGPGPFGAKAVGETTNSGVAPAIANAVYDAVGVRIKTYPITAERVHAALQEKTKSAPRQRVESGTSP